MKRKSKQAKHHRRSPRLPEYDYTQPGAYFVTVCVKGKQCRLGKIVDGEMAVSKEGEIVTGVWENLPTHYSHIELDEFVVMPNHVHGIIWILEHKNDRVGEGLRPSPTSSKKIYGLLEIVRAFKSFSSRQINELRDTKGSSFWQRSFYDHIIRDEEDLYQHRKYINQNVLKWLLDEYHSPE